MESKESLETLIGKVLEKNSVLFVGAGFSFNATNIKQNNLMTAKQLAENLYSKCQIESDGNLSNAVNEYTDRHGEFELIELLKNEFTVTGISREHEIITSLPWKRIYTTNYDNTIELGYSKNRKLATPVTLNDKPWAFKDKSKLCIHLNGYIERLTPDSLVKEFKLSDVSYLTSDFLDSEWVTLFRNDVKTCDTLFFVGFSLNFDLDLKRILFNHPETHSKTSFIMHENETTTNIRNASKFGSTFSIGLAAFAEHISNVKKNYSPPADVKMIYQSFKKIEIQSKIVEIKDVDTIQLFFNGNIKQEFIELSIVDPETYRYFINRDKLPDIVKEINEGKKNFLIHSDLGNGKTIFLQGLSILLKSSGYEVFVFNKEYETLDKEIENICTSEKKPIIIVESYSSNLNVLERLKLFRTKDVVLILSERSLINDTFYTKIEDNIIEEEYNTYDLNTLSNGEISKLIDLFDSYGFWGQYSNFSPLRKQNLISVDCKKNLRLLLLKILNSPDIQNRFSKILNSIQGKRNFYNAVIIILTSNIFDFPLDLDGLTYILEDDLLNNPSFSNNAALKEIINFDTRTINVRSSVLSEAILSHIDEKKVIIDCLIKVAIKLDKGSYDRSNFNTLKSIVSFSRLQRVLDQKRPEYKSTILYFFEQVKNLNSYRKNPYFWLQYAIARLSVKDYDNADLHFKTAYSYADAKEAFDTFQIDNHYARYILETEIYFGIPDTCMQQFLKAHNILNNNQSENSLRHYPIRVAQNYIPFYETFFENLSTTDKTIFLSCCKEILRKIENYLVKIKSPVKKEVQSCRQNLLDIISKNLTIGGGKD